MEKIKVGFCITGSFCTFEKVLKEMKNLVDKNYDVTAVVSDNAKSLDTRFYKAKDFLEELKKITGKEVIDSIVKAEPIGPKNYFDILVVAPATGNTIAKISRGITDTTVTMAVKSHLRKTLFSRCRYDKTRRYRSLRFERRANSTPYCATQYLAHTTLNAQ